MKRTITLKDNTWKELNRIKYSAGYETIDDLINVLLGHHTMEKRVKGGMTK